MGLTSEQRDWLTLALAPGVGTVKFIRLLARFGTPGRVLRASANELADVVGANLAARIKQYVPATDIEMQERLMGKHQVSLLTMDDPAYPSQLAEIYDPPLLLFMRGSLVEEDACAVAIVGTRRATGIGEKITRKLAAELAERGITVISGLAEGIDAAAHQGALEAGGRTIAVLPSGQDQISPAGNISLLEQIVQHGCALTPFPMGVRALRGNFPQRNRIISGLSLGVVVVEAPPGSGALITARFAAEQGREVFAVPGIAGHINSRGPHELIRDGAKLVENVDDILVELTLPAAKRQLPHPRPGEKPVNASLETIDPPPQRRDPPPPKATPPLSPQEQDILSVLHPEGSFVDEIALACRLSISETLAALTMLELKGVVLQKSGKRFSPK